jgi:hypothetical protein
MGFSRLQDNSLFSQISPEWTRISNPSARVHRLGNEPAVFPLLLARQETHRVGFLWLLVPPVARIGQAVSATAMNFDIVELSQTVLKLFEGAPVSPACFCMAEQGFEVLTAVPKFLDCDARFVPFRGIELSQSLHLFDDLPRAAIKDISRDGDNRFRSKSGRGAFNVRPLPIQQPERRRKAKIAKPVVRNGSTRARELVLAFALYILV